MKEDQEIFNMKNKASEKRHEDNLIEVQKKKEELEKETEEREFNKYITYYFLKKGQSQALSKLKKKQNNKLQEKAERLDELERKNDERREGLVNKMKTMDKRREAFKKKKEKKVIEDKIQREEKMNNIKKNQEEMDIKNEEKMYKLLDKQTEHMYKSLNMNQTNIALRTITQEENSITNQIALKESEYIFKKKLNDLKSQSIIRKSPEDKLKLYRQLKRQEAEDAKRKKEEELFNKGLIK
jgi:hypothetical protein